MKFAFRLYLHISNRANWYHTGYLVPWAKNRFKRRQSCLRASITVLRKCSETVLEEEGRGGAKEDYFAAFQMMSIAYEAMRFDWHSKLFCLLLFSLGGSRTRFSRKTATIHKWWSIASKRIASNRAFRDPVCPHSPQTRSSASAVRPISLASIRIRRCWWRGTIAIIQLVFLCPASIMTWVSLSRPMTIGPNPDHFGCT